MNYLITGGAGYLGSRLVFHLAENNPASKVFYTHHRKLENNLFSAFSNVHFRKLDLENTDDYNGLCKEVDTVIHLAFPNELVCKSDTELSIKNGVTGTYRLLEQAKNEGAKNFLFISTAHVYGKLNGRISEDTLPTPHHPYAIIKRAAEDFALSFQNPDFRVAVFRLSNGFGYPVHPNINRWSLLSNDLCRQAITHNTLTLNSGGTQQRDFISFTDVVRAISFFCNKEGLIANGIFNLGSGRSFTIFEFAQLVAKEAALMTGKDIPVLIKGKKEDSEAEVLIYENQKLRNLGFEFENNFDEEIRQTLNFCLKNV